ncbi:MAG: hypothetical protein ACR2NM_02265 [Bythopirellula sp.]
MVTSCSPDVDLALLLVVVRDLVEGLFFDLVLGDFVLWDFELWDFVLLGFVLVDLVLLDRAAVDFLVAFFAGIGGSAPKLAQWLGRSLGGKNL